MAACGTAYRADSVGIHADFFRMPAHPTDRLSEKDREA